MVSERRKAKVIGVGFDCDDGKMRITRAPNFHLVGGSQQTHEVMQEKCIKFNEKLGARGKEIEDLNDKEFIDLAAECEMKMHDPQGEQQDKGDRPG